MARLIDPDLLKEVMIAEWFLDILATKESTREIKKMIENAIDSVPLAYDVEKVVAEIEEDKFKHPFDEDEELINSYIDRAIKAVRKGGVE